MSQSVKTALLASRDLRGTDRLVLLAIAAHANHAGDAWPSVATIAEYVGCSERTVQRCLARLVQAGRLTARRVAGIATRVYRIVVETVTSAVDRVTSGLAGVTEQPVGGDSPGVSPEVEDPSKMKPRARARDWRRFLPKTKTTSRPPYPPERRGAALPPPAGTDRCRRHPGELAHNCRCCRAEALAGGVR